MNDATNVMMDAMATALYNNTTNTQQFIGLPGAVDDGTTLQTYGNINRSTYTWWKSKQYAAGSVNPTRQNILQYISGTVKNGAEVPSALVFAALVLGRCWLKTLLVKSSTSSPLALALTATTTARRLHSAP
jgi:hypothetical protein